MPKKKSHLPEKWTDHTLARLLKTSITPMQRGESSYLIVTCNNLHLKPLKEFEVEDLRIMIGQSIGLPYLVPLAIDALQQDILAEGDYYEGDLLKSVLTSDPDHWKAEKQDWRTIVNLFEQNRAQLDAFDTTENIRSGWIEAFEAFKQINA